MQAYFDGMPISEEERQYLAHFGVKGMKWGVRKRRDGGSSGPISARRQIKGLKAQRDAEQAAALKRFTAAENRSAAAYDKAYKQSRAAGAGRIQSHKNASRDAAYRQATRDEARAERQQVREHKQAERKFQAGKVAISEAKKNWHNKTGGEKVKAILGSNGGTIGTQHLYSVHGNKTTRGERFAAAMLGVSAVPLIDSGRLGGKRR